MVRPSLQPAGLGQFLLLWLLLLPPMPDPRVEAQRTWPSPFCPAVCEPMRCPPLPTCSSGATPVQDRCRCCRVCPAAEGEVCGGVLGRPCAPGLQCSAPFRPRRLGGTRLGTCGCPATGAAVCGSDGRTYPSLCALRAENRAARRRGALPALPVQKGDCRDRGGCRPGALLKLSGGTFLNRAALHGFCPAPLAVGIPLLAPDFLPSWGVSLRVPMWFPHPYPHFPPHTC